jgi:predicted AAA+ superfamily ATPase
LEFKAKKINVSLENPFEQDKLERKPDVDNVSVLLRNISSPIVLSVNAPWGAGKTTFLEMLHADLLNNGCRSIYFNAWQTDFANDPLLAFLGEMNQALESLVSG